MKRPDVLKQWDDECSALRERMPRVCANCYHVDVLNGDTCKIHEATPPPDFAETAGACPDWKDEVPF
jgi:hypothetical protein